MRDDEPERPHIERIPTGIRGLDTVLGGGLLAGSVQLLMGRPGSGKTILANQMAFHRAAAGRTAAYVTLLAESHARMLAHLGPFAFFDPSLVSRRILYMSGYGVLDQSGLDGLLELLTRTTREHGVSLLIIDGLSTAKEFAPTTNAFKRFLLSLNTSASLTGCTMLLVSTVNRVADAHPENATVDGIIRLGKRIVEARVAREMVIEKMRATKYALGPHAVDIDDQGLHVFPRIESLAVEPFVATNGERRVQFGIEGLDALLGGGVLAGSTTAIIGATGSGKTLLGSSFLASGIARGEPGIYVGTRERPDRVIDQAKRVGLNLERGVQAGTLTLSWYPTTEVSLDEIVWRLLSQLDRAPHQRVFIDGLEGLRALLIYPQREKHFFTTLVAQLNARDATTVLAEIATNAQAAEQTAAVISPNNVLTLGAASEKRKPRRHIVALKVQGGAHDLSPHRLRISDQGLSVDTPLLSKVRGGKP